ncbi:MAG: oligosaccharide flippase family protein [Clostridiales bacterium]|nr:oligosaccharide flippase family protein [Clostridiales bacterium]
MSGTDGKSIQQNMIFNTVGSLVYYACQWLMSVIIVRISGFDDVGLLSLAMSATSAPGIVGLFNVRSYQVSDIDGQYTDREYIRSRIYTNMLSVAVCLGVVLFYGYSAEKAVIILVFMAFKVAEGMADVYYGIYQKNQRLDFAGISLTIRGLGSLACFLGVFFASGSLLLSIVIMSAFSMSIVLLYDRKQARKYQVGEKEDRKMLLKQVRLLLITCLPLAVVSFLNNLSLTIPKLYLESYFGETIMGIYSSVASPTIVIQLAATTLFAPLIPPLTLEFSRGRRRSFLKKLGQFAALIGGLTVLALILAKILGRWALVLLFGSEIEPYVYLFIPVIIISILIAVNASMFSICTLMRAIRIQYVIGAAAIAAALIGSLTLVKGLSMNGVVLALGLTLCVQIAIQIFIICGKMRKMGDAGEHE